jgi:hypothetical protein
MCRSKCLLPAVLLLAALLSAGCKEVVKEIDKPVPAPPYDPKGAALDPSLVQPSENQPPPAEKK